MKRYLDVSAVLAMSFMSSVFVTSLSASELDQKTVITIHQPVAVQGTVLPAGRYVLKLQNSWFSRNVVSILNAEETRVIVSVLANRAYRLQATDKSEFSFYSASSAQPAALHKWFYPGEENGFEFLNPQHRAPGEHVSVVRPGESSRQSGD